MSRIIYNLVNSILGTNKNQYVIFHSNTVQDLDIVSKIGGECLSFEKNIKDTLNLIKVITDAEISNDLRILPKYIICTNIARYEASKNLSFILRVPIINIFCSIENIKREAAFNLANLLNEDINIFYDKKIADILYITKYIILNNIIELPSIIEQEYKKWKPV